MRVQLRDAEAIASASTWNDETKWMTSGSCLGPSARFDNDVRSATQSIVGSNEGHSEEFCGLKWDEEGKLVLACTDDDRLLCIWDLPFRTADQAYRKCWMMLAGAGSVSPRFVTDYKKAVKGLDWCPSRRALLGSGGSSADECIKFWDFDVCRGHGVSSDDIVETL